MKAPAEELFLQRILLVSLVGVMFAFAWHARAEVIPIGPAATASSYDSGEIDVSGYVFAVQTCGGTDADVFSGALAVQQGLATGRLVQTWASGTVTSQSGCSVVTFSGGFKPSALARVIITRTGGKSTTWLYRWPVR